jgi:hypothetical protein
MSINLTISLSHPSAVATQVRYARIDNLAPGQQPVFTTVPNLAGGVGVFDIATDLPNGQYQINYTPIYADGRQCTTYITTTPGCPGLTSISAAIQGNVIVINYLAPSGAPNVFITVQFPNGGSFQQLYVNDGNPISIGIPSGVYGNYTVNGQAVCDAVSGFYSPLSTTVTVVNGQPISGTYYLGNSQAAVCAAGPTTLYSNGAPIPSVTLYTDEGLTTQITGYSLVMYQNVIYNLSSVSGVLGNNSGLTCGTYITGNTSYSASLTNGSGLIYGPAGSTVSVSIAASGPPGGTYTLSFTIAALALNQNVSNGTNTFTFTMPLSGSVAWSAAFTETNSDGAGSITVP